MTVWFTPKQAAAYLKVDVVTLRRAVKRGDLSAFRIGTRLRYRAEDLDGWVLKAVAA